MRWLIVIALCVLPRIAVAAVAHSSTTTNSGATDTLTVVNHVVGGGADYALVVIVSIKGGETVSSVTWNGGAEVLTSLGTDINVDARVYVYFRAAPTAATDNVVVTLTGSTLVAVAAHTYTGVHQTVPFRLVGAATNNGVDAAPTVNITALAGEMVVDGLAQVSAGPDTAAADHTERANLAELTGGSDLRCASQEKASAGAVETMGWTMSDSDNWAVVAGPLQDVSASASRRVIIVN